MSRSGVQPLSRPGRQSSLPFPLNVAAFVQGYVLTLNKGGHVQASDDDAGNRCTPRACLEGTEPRATTRPTCRIRSWGGPCGSTVTWRRTQPTLKARVGPLRCPGGGARRHRGSGPAPLAGRVRRLVQDRRPGGRCPTAPAGRGSQCARRRCQRPDRHRSPRQHPCNDVGARRRRPARRDHRRPSARGTPAAVRRHAPRGARGTGAQRAELDRREQLQPLLGLVRATATRPGLAISSTTSAASATATSCRRSCRPRWPTPSSRRSTPSSTATGASAAP